MKEISFTLIFIPLITVGESQVKQGPPELKSAIVQIMEKHKANHLILIDTPVNAASPKTNLGTYDGGMKGYNIDMEFKELSTVISSVIKTARVSYASRGYFGNEKKYDYTIYIDYLEPNTPKYKSLAFRWVVSETERNLIVGEPDVNKE